MRPSPEHGCDQSGACAMMILLNPIDCRGDVAVKDLLYQNAVITSTIASAVSDKNVGTGAA
jgi:hypothetical protein